MGAAVRRDDRQFVNSDVPVELQRQVQMAVLDELQQWGVDRFSVEALAGRCGIDPEVVYRYWGDRDRVLLDALFSYSDSFIVVPDTGSLRDDLRGLMLSVARYLNTDFGRTVLRSVLPHSEGYLPDEVRLVFWTRRMRDARVVFERAVARGEMKDGDVTAMAALANLMSPVHVRALYIPGPIDDEFCIAMSDMTWRALTNPVE